MRSFPRFICLKLSKSYFLNYYKTTWEVYRWGWEIKLIYAPVENLHMLANGQMVKCILHLENLLSIYCPLACEHLLHTFPFGDLSPKLNSLVDCGLFCSTTCFSQLWCLNKNPGFRTKSSECCLTWEGKDLNKTSIFCLFGVLQQLVKLGVISNIWNCCAGVIAQVSAWYKYTKPI